MDEQDRWFTEYERELERMNEWEDARERERLDRLDDYAGPAFRCENPEAAWIAEMREEAA